MNISHGGLTMNDEVRKQIVTLLAAEMEAYGENLDALEGQLLCCLREIGQGTLRAVTAAKKGGTWGADCPAHAGRRRGLSATEPRR
jgi:hypothetical protein